MKKISIIVAIYNVEQFIAKCVKSVYDQGMREDEFELILVNDGSTDNSLPLAEKLIESKSNAIIISQENRGLGGARNTGILNSSAEYLLFLDTDDWLLPNSLRDVINLAKNERLDVLEFAAQGVKTNGEVAYHISNNSKALSGVEYYNNIRYMNSACNKLYKRSFLLNNDIIFLERIFIEDFEFNTRVFAKAKRVLATDLLVAQFLQSPNSITRNTNAEKKKKMICDILIVLRKTKEIYQDYQSSNDFETDRFFKERLGFLVATLFYQLFKNKAGYGEIKEIKQQLIEDQLCYINHPIFQKNKDLFRIIMLNNFWIFKITQPILKVLKGDS